MGSCDAAKALAEGQRAARSVIPEWDRATPQKLWPKANAQWGSAIEERVRGFSRGIDARKRAETQVR
jgi:hypothetical protein